MAAKHAHSRQFTPPQVVLALVYQYVEGTAQSMQQSEARNWDPAPKNMAKNEVTILYCSS